MSALLVSRGDRLALLDAYARVVAITTVAAVGAREVRDVDGWRWRLRDGAVSGCGAERWARREDRAVMARKATRGEIEHAEITRAERVAAGKVELLGERARARREWLASAERSVEDHRLVLARHEAQLAEAEAELAAVRARLAEIGGEP